MNFWRNKHPIKGYFLKKWHQRKRCSAKLHATVQTSPHFPPCPGTITSKLRWEIISAYSQVLERCSSPVESESSLPYPKELIRQAIYEELTEHHDGEFRNHLEIAFVQLESFIPPEEYRVLEDFKMVGSLAQKLARTGSPADIIASARILRCARGDCAVRIQEDISRKMQERMEQVRSIAVPFLA